MNYIESLRQHIGHAPILMVGAAILILDDQKRLLLLKRSDSGFWGPPGGAVEPREVVEEAALQVGEMLLFGVDDIPEDLSPPIEPVVERFKK